MTHHRSAPPRKIRRRGRPNAFHNCQLCVTSIIPFCASRSYNNRGLKRFCFWQISRCHCYIADDLFYFDIWFRPDFFMPCVSPVAYILTGDVWWSCIAGRWSILQKAELISAARWSVLHCQRPGNATLKQRTRRCVSFDVRSSPFIYQYQIIKSSSSSIRDDYRGP